MRYFKAFYEEQEDIIGVEIFNASSLLKEIVKPIEKRLAEPRGG